MKYYWNHEIIGETAPQLDIFFSPNGTYSAGNVLRHYHFLAKGKLPNTLVYFQGIMFLSTN